MLILLCLLALTAAQTCPYCQYNACSVTSYGLGNCTACNVGTLIEMTYTPMGGYGPQTVGVCQMCPANCNACQIAVIPSAFGPSFPFMNCTSCAYGFLQSNSPVTGGCVATTTASLQTDEQTNTPSNSGSSNLGVTIGLSIWGAVMTIAAVVFLALWITKKEAKPTTAPLLNSEIEVGRITA